MNRRESITHGVQGVLAAALGATYADARKVPVLEERIKGLQSEIENLRAWLTRVSRKERYFHGQEDPT